MTCSVTDQESTWDVDQWSLYSVAIRVDRSVLLADPDVVAVVVDALQLVVHYIVRESGRERV